jgi:Flp pilus assembly protein TadG
MVLSAIGHERGVATVEFAVVLPLMLLLILGVTEIGRAIVRYNAVTKAVRDGARYAAAQALLGTTGVVNVDAALQSDVANLVVYGNTAGTGSPLVEGLTTAQITVVDAGGGTIRVDADYPYQPFTGSTLPTFGLGPDTALGFNMQASVSMRAL